MNTSLTKFCKDTGLAKTSVYRRAQELGIDTSQGLTPDAVDQLKAEFDCSAQAIAPEVMPAGFIQCGKLATTENREIQLPEGFNPAAMVRFFDGVTGQATDTRSLVAIADLALNAVESAMDEKLSEQELKLRQARQDAKALQERISATKTTLQIKALKSEMLATQQTEATKTAEELFAELMAMGKPSQESQESA